MRCLSPLSLGLESCVMEGGERCAEGRVWKGAKRMGDRPRYATGARAQLPPSKDQILPIVKVGVLVAVVTPCPICGE